MKRSPLKRTQGLRSKPTGPRKALKRATLATSPQDAAESAAIAKAKAKWKETRRGKCAICGRRQLIFRHHIVYQQHIRAEHGGVDHLDEWDLRNALDVGAFCRCHANHHQAVKRIPVDLLPDAAFDFAIELYGQQRAGFYFARYYKEDHQ